MDVIFASESALDESLPGKETARLLNMYPEKGGVSPVSLRSVPGLKQTTSLGSGCVRSMISDDTNIYAAVGGKFVIWDGSSVTEHGNIPDSAATMARNRTQIAVTAGGNYYVWNGTTFALVPGAAFTNIGSVAYIDNIMLLSQLDGESYQYSAVGDADSLDALDFASAESSPDDLVRIIVVGNVVWMMGADSVEAWQNAGLQDNPFRRVSDLRLEKGLRSASEVGLLDNTFMWVSNEGRAYRQTGGQPVNVSSDAVAASLNLHTDVVAFSYQHNNHDFFCLRPSDRPAWVYDPGTQRWHERSTGPTHQPWEVTATVQHNGIWYAGTATGELCTFEGFNDKGERLRREAQSTLLRNGGERFTINQANLRLEGAGDLMMQISRDGRIYGKERIKAFGGSFSDECTFRGLGQCREFSMRVACSDDTDFAIHGASIG